MASDQLFVKFRLAIHDYSKESDGIGRLDLVRNIHSAFKSGGLSPISYNHLLVLLNH